MFKFSEDLKVNQDDRSGATCVDLSSVPNLKDLTIPGSIGFPATIQLLETTPHLNNLILKFSIDLYGELAFDRMDWSPLLTFFSRSWDKFQHIEIHLQSHLSWRNFSEFIPSVDTLPRLYCSDLMAKGILDIRVTKWNVY